MALILTEPFTDTDNTVITSHTAVTTWTEHPVSGAGNAAKIVSNKLVSNDTAFKGYYSSVVPSSADYTIECDFTYHTGVGQFYLWGRLDTSLFNCIRAHYNSGSGFRIQAVWNNGANGNASSYYNPTLVAGTTYHLKFVMSGSNFTLYIDGTSRATLTDSNVTAVGRGGFATTSAVTSASVGYEIDNLTITDTSITQTQGVAVAVKAAGLTKTQGVAVKVIDQTSVVRTQSGKITSDDFTGVTRMVGDGQAVSLSGGAASVSLGAAYSGYLGAYRQSRMPNSVTTDGSGTGAAKLRLSEDFVICADLTNNAAGNSSMSVGVFADANNGYLLKVANTSGGTSSIRSIKTGTETQQQTATEGIANAATKRVKFYRSGNTFGATVGSTTFSTYTDSSPVTVSTPYFAAQTASTGDLLIDNLEICCSQSIIVRNVPTGGTVRVYDATGATLASAAESSGTATLDLSAQMFPLTCYIKVFTDSYTTQATNGRFPGDDGSGLNTTTVRGGDEFYYDLTTHQVIGTEFASSYATTQVDSHNGAIVHSGEVFGAAIGWEGSVLAWRTLDGATTPAYTVEVAAKGTLFDQHQACSIQADSSGYLHIIYGGYHDGVTLYHVKSTNPWDISSWGTPVSVGTGIDGALLLDDLDYLYVVGTQAVSGTINKRIVALKSTNSGATWSSTTIADAATDWLVYLSDATVGKESSSKSLYATFFSYSPSLAISSRSMTTTSGSSTVTTASTTGIVAGALMTHSGVASNTYVLSVDSSTQVTLSKPATSTATATATFGVIYKDCLVIRSTDRGANWKGVTGGNFTLPLTQTNSSGDYSASALHAISRGGCYVPKVGVSADNTKLYVAFYQLGYSSAAGSPIFPTVVTLGSSVGTPQQLATGANTHGAIDEVLGQVVYVGTNAATCDIVRYLSSDSGVTWRVDTMVDGKPDSYPPQWYWPKITPVAGQSYVKTVWQSRKTLYGVTGGSTLTGEGVASLLIANVQAVVSQTQGVAVRVSAQITKTQGVAVNVSSAQTQTASIAVEVYPGVGSSRTTTTSLAVRVSASSVTKTATIAVLVADTYPYVPQNTAERRHRAYRYRRRGGEW